MLALLAVIVTLHLPAPKQACFTLLPDDGVKINGYDHTGAQKGPKLKTGFGLFDLSVDRRPEASLVRRCAPRKRKA